MEVLNEDDRERVVAEGAAQQDHPGGSTEIPDQSGEQMQLLASGVEGGVSAWGDAPTRTATLEDGVGVLQRQTLVVDDDGSGQGGGVGGEEPPVTPGGGAEVSPTPSHHPQALDPHLETVAPAAAVAEEAPPAPEVAPVSPTPLLEEPVAAEEGLVGGGSTPVVEDAHPVLSTHPSFPGDGPAATAAAVAPEAAVIEAAAAAAAAAHAPPPPLPSTPKPAATPLPTLAAPAPEVPSLLRITTPDDGASRGQSRRKEARSALQRARTAVGGGGTGEVDTGGFEFLVSGQPLPLEAIVESVPALVPSSPLGSPIQRAVAALEPGAFLAVLEGSGRGGGGGGAPSFTPSTSSTSTSVAVTVMAALTKAAKRATDGVLKQVHAPTLMVVERGVRVEDVRKEEARRRWEAGRHPPPRKPLYDRASISARLVSQGGGFFTYTPHTTSHHPYVSPPGPFHGGRWRDDDGRGSSASAASALYHTAPHPRRPVYDAQAVAEKLEREGIPFQHYFPHPPDRSGGRRPVSPPHTFPPRTRPPSPRRPVYDPEYVERIRVEGGHPFQAYRRGHPGMSQSGGGGGGGGGGGDSTSRGSIRPSTALPSGRGGHGHLGGNGGGSSRPYTAGATHH